MTVVAELLRAYIQLHDVEYYVLYFLNKVEMENLTKCFFLTRFKHADNLKFNFVTYLFSNYVLFFSST
jgi:hypothetical protein